MVPSFAARRRKPELVRPAQPTPHEYKALSDIDDQLGLRFYPAGIEFFQSASSGAAVDEDPVGLIRAALAEALVSYYPLAGRLLELPVAAGGKMLVECTAEGVVFVEADADVRIEDFGQPLVPPYPCAEELLCYDIVEPQEVVFAKPLLFLQVTRFRDNDGFAIGYRYCHNVIDGFGMAQLLGDVYKLARGEDLTLLPVWGRELLTARAPSHVTHNHNAYEELPAASAAAKDIFWKTPLEHMVTRHFRFGPRELATMRSQVPASLLRSATAFELVAAAVWRCRAAALAYAPSQPLRVLIVSNARRSWKPCSPIPPGFYGNALVMRAAEAAAGELCGSPPRHALELVRAARVDVTDEYVRSMLDLLALRRRPFYSLDWTFTIADVTGLARREAKFGRWERFGGGITATGRVVAASLVSYYGRYKSGSGGEECVVVSMCLPPAAMDRFAQQISAWGNKSSVTSSL
ncbi:unnamed protein product [Urochloa humidicola]